MMPSSTVLHLSLTGVELTNDLSISLPLAVILVGVVMFVGRNAWLSNQNATEIATLKAEMKSLNTAQTSQENRLTRLETTTLHIQQTTDKTHALVQAMAAGLKAA